MKLSTHKNKTIVCTRCKKRKANKYFGVRRFKTNKLIDYPEGFYLGYRSRCKSCEVASTRDRQNAAEYKRKFRDSHRYDIKSHIQERVSNWRNKELGITSDLTVSYLLQLYNNQNGKCFYTGDPMVFGARKGKALPNSLSLDRLDPNKGYTIGNVVWCTYLVNTMKQQMTEGQFYDKLRLILTTRGLQ